jgi:hypothetical protein
LIRAESFSFIGDRSYHPFYMRVDRVNSLEPNDIAHEEGLREPFLGSRHHELHA